MLAEKLQLNPAYSPENWEYVERVNDYLEQSGTTQAALARAAGVKAATLNSVIKGNYPTDPSGHLAKLIDCIEREQQRRADAESVPYVETSVAKLVYKLCSRCHRDKDFGVMTGRVGTGKTSAAKRYCEQTPSAILIEALPGMPVAPLLSQIIAALKLTLPRRLNQSAKLYAIVDALKGSDRLIVVDEAEHLADKSLEYLRRLSDSAGIGVMLIGTINLLPLVKSPDGKFGQISSRIGVWPAPVERIAADDVELMAQAVWGEQLTPALTAAYAKACEGSARALRNLLRNTRRYCANRDTAPTPQIIASINLETMGARDGLGARASRPPYKQ